ncbi:MAG: hypothetical protein H6R46_346 [Proteobacteria bacterium]|nr:hypothetical protein [Pseudomonadota bacterium]
MNTTPTTAMPRAVEVFITITGEEGIVHVCIIR